MVVTAELVVWEEYSEVRVKRQMSVVGIVSVEGVIDGEGATM